MRSAATEAVKNNNRLILVAGASCAGKTTTSKKIALEIEKSGGKAQTVSLDDFYHNPADSPFASDENPDYEAPECLDIPLIKKTMADISHGRPTHVPEFSFEKKKRLETPRLITPDKDTFIIVEGLHALNPDLIGEESRDAAYKVYLICESSVSAGDSVGAYDAKLLRRLVRDYHFRKASAELTFSLWENVKKGEAVYIYPYKSVSDKIINTFFDYEISAFKEEGEKVLSAVGENSPYRTMADGLLGLLSGTEALGKGLIPDGSLLWEFLK